MTSGIRKTIGKMKEASAKISTLISDIKNIPEHLLEFDLNRKMDALFTEIVKLYSHLTCYNRQASGMYSIPKSPTVLSGMTEIQEMRDDYIKIKMPLLYRKNKEDSIIVNDLDMAFFNILESGGKIPSIQKKEIIFTFYYSSDTDKNLIRDNDNYSTRRIINTIVRYLQSSDSGDSTWLSFRTKIQDGIENHTIVEVKKRD